MTRIIIPESIRAQLGGLNEPLEFCDEEGNPVGTFAPMSTLTEQQRIGLALPSHLRDSETPVGELRRRLHEEGRIGHEEVLRMARQRQ